MPPSAGATPSLPTQPCQQGSRDDLADRQPRGGRVSSHFCDHALREFDGERRLGVANRNRFFEMLGLPQVAVSLTRGDRALPSQFPDCLGQVESPEQVASSFVSDRLADGRWFRILTVVDQY